MFEVPKQTPEGEYLLRLDLIWPGIIDPPADGFGDPQIYTSCAHIHVSSDATGPLPKGIKIPEDIGSDSPGMFGRDFNALPICLGQTIFANGRFHCYSQACVRLLTCTMTGALTRAMFIPVVPYGLEKS